MKRIVLFILLTALISASIPYTQATAAQMDIAPLFQADYTDTLFMYKGQERSVASSGCAPTCAAMIIQYFNPKTDQTPETLLRYAYAQKLYTGNGLIQKALLSLLDTNGIQYRWRDLAKTSLRESLEAGKPIIAYMGKGYFSSSGHYIVLTGIDEDGNVSVIDPNSRDNSSKTYPSKLILKQSRGSLPFIVCEKADEV